MATRNTDTYSRKEQTPTQSNKESIRWTVGLLLIAIGLFGLLSVLFSFFCWEQDQSGLMMTIEERAIHKVDVENFCGWSGARLGALLVDHSFGIFGVLIPLMLILSGVRIIRLRHIPLNHTLLALIMITIFGSLTLGVAFADRWSLCASTGWGGSFGIESAAWLHPRIGLSGTIILLLAGWILIGVFINQNFIKTVNTAGDAMLNKGERFFGFMRRKVSVSQQDNGEQTTSSKFESENLDPRAIRQNQLQNTTQSRDQAEYDDMEYPFLEHPQSPDENFPVSKETDRTTASTTDEDSIFTEVDVVPQAEGRLVMGSNGLVELSRHSPMPDSEIAQEANINNEPTKHSDDNGPFIEIDLHPERKETPISETSEATPHELDESEEDIPEGLVVTVETHKAKMVDEEAISTESYDPMKDLINYRKPPVTLLEDYTSDSEVSSEEIYENKVNIEETLKNFGIPIQKIKATVGPTVTLYEIVQAQGVKISKIQGLQNDIAQSLKAESGIRIIAPIPGKGTIGIEVPNRHKQIVSMYSAIRSQRFQESKAELPVVIGRTIQNENYVFDLAKAPHMLVAGATGQGKSVGLNAIITSLLYRKHPAQLKFVMIDPKMVEFSLYAKLERHFLAKMESEDEAVITDPKKAVYTLNSLCTEMDSRLELCKNAAARNIKEYNDKFVARRLNPQKGHRYLPYIVVVIDEFADLIMMAKEVEAPVIRLAQKARAVGIHLIIATQRPSVDVITGKIKANFPTRIAFRVVQRIDSQTIIDQPGANQLIGRGDMLFSKDGELTRVQCALVDTPEVERIVEHICKQQSYTAPYGLPDYTPESGDGGGFGSEETSAPIKYDSLFAEIARDAVASGQISTSMIQRNYEVGFNRAGRIMTQLERAGIVGRQQGAKPREILYHDSPSLEAKLQDLGLF
ncbi:MAG: DNA translocase FtsK [Rikenellaceae bacterium]|nr:DNA translocase FtsK [Rikenellaceae bacterium]